MAKTFEFENEDRVDISKESITEEDAKGKQILITQPEDTSTTLMSLNGELQDAEVVKARAQAEIDRIAGEIDEVKIALNIVKGD